jgi:hypothetical protein
LFEVGQPGAELLDQRVEQPRVEHGRRVAGRAATDPGDAQVGLGRGRLAEVLDRPQAAAGRVEERDQVGDDQVVAEQHAVAVRGDRAELAQVPHQWSQVLRPAQAQTPPPPPPAAAATGRCSSSRPLVGHARHQTLTRERAQV